ncbi:MAG: TolC family protein [Verrucomicrobiota bacterium]
MRAELFVHSLTPVRFLVFLSLPSLFGVLLSSGADEQTGREIEDEEIPLLILREAIRIGVESNFGIRVQVLNPLIELENTSIAEATFDPQLSASVSWRESKSAQAASTLEGAAQPQDENLDAGASISKRFSPGTEVSAGSDLNRRETNSANALLNPDYTSEFGVEVRQPLLRDFGTEVNLASLRSAKSGFLESQIVYEGELASLFEQIVASYWQVAAANRRLELRESSIRLAELLLRRTEEELSLGLATRSDVLQAQAELATRQEAKLQSEKNLSDRKDELRFLLGEDLRSSAPFRTIPLPPPAEEADSFAKVMRDALVFDPGRRSLEQEIDQRYFDILLANNTTRPDLDLVLGGDYLGREDELSESYRQAIDGDGYRWRAGLELSFPWGFAEQKARKRQSVLRLRQTEVQVEEAEARVRQEVRAAWRQNENGLAQLESARATVRLRVEVVEAEEARRERGLADISDVLEAARLLDDARLREVDAILETTLARTRLSELDGSIFEKAGFDAEALVGRSIGEGESPSDPPTPPETNPSDQ